MAGNRAAVKYKSKRRQLAVGRVLGVLAALVLVAACGRGGANPRQTSEDAFKGVPVRTAAAVTGDIVNTIVAGGRLQARAEVALAPKIPGKVAEVRVEVGQRVSQGETLAVLENRESAAQLRQAEASLAQALANRGSLEANYRRMEALLADGAVARQQFDSARAAYLTAEAQVKQAQAAVDLAKNNFDHSFVISPVDGLIGSRNLQPGALAGAGTPLVTVVDLSQVLLEAGVGESQVNRITLGQTVRIRVPSLAGSRDIYGRIASVSPAMDPRTHNFQVRIMVDNPDQILKSGMYAEAVLETGRKAGAIVVPAEALAERDSGKVVYVVVGDRVSERRVKVGLSNPDYSEIVEGVSAGEAVVVSGHNLLGDKSSVRVENK